MTWHIGDVIRKMRAVRNMKQAPLAKKANVRPNTLSKIERFGTAANYQAGTIESLAAALDTTPERLGQEVPHTLQECAQRVSYSVQLPDDDESRRLASLWRALKRPEDRQFVITSALLALKSSGDDHDDGKDHHGHAKPDRPSP